LYSSNQVLIGGIAVTVGTNPTAVATFASDPERVAHRDGCDWISDTYSGTTRAIVANSGSNTVSILDIANDTLLYNVTVGNRPVALAVSSDSTSAYVANYQDSTVSQIDLIAGSVTATVPVGGMPTSVALTSSGTLWVGGVGFLTEIEAQTMSVTATESTANKSIIALAYSDSLGELVATTTDAAANVYTDEIAPSTVHTGGSYAPLASHRVSGLGTHFNQNTQTQVHSYTATLASVSSISTNQIGAPPLVVQDGWAVVTATPTGFTITDASGHVVLISETTPSPVTAIAVDTNLSVVYLTMPDSNTLLTVPLPGTGTN
jgi:YVTN family beta-propeller protein